MTSTIFDSQGRVKFQIHSNENSKRILDASGRLLGFIQNGKTYNSCGTLVSHGEDISTLTVKE